MNHCFQMMRAGVRGAALGIVGCVYLLSTIFGCNRETEWTRRLPNGYLIYEVDASGDYKPSGCIVGSFSGEPYHFPISERPNCHAKQVAIVSNRFVLVSLGCLEGSKETYEIICIDTLNRTDDTLATEAAAKLWLEKQTAKPLAEKLRWVDPLSLDSYP